MAYEMLAKESQDNVVKEVSYEMLSRKKARMI